ncbi:MAG: hypothetical protein LBB23_01865 [Rickettsiales bacterium]|nr:hypothetical protein [Rickettsiales bacterium]
MRLTSANHPVCFADTPPSACASLRRDKPWRGILFGRDCPIKSGNDLLPLPRPAMPSTPSPAKGTIELDSHGGELFAWAFARFQF